MVADLITHTTTTPLPNSVSRNDALRFLHDHPRMISLNPLVTHFEPTRPASYASRDDYHYCSWYLLIDAVSYIPCQTSVRTDIAYKAAYRNLRDGLYTHTFAPKGVDIQSRWSIHDTRTREGTRRRRLREKVDLRCDPAIAHFVTRNLERCHATLVDSILAKVEEDRHRSVIIEELLSTEKMDRELRGAKSPVICVLPPPSPSASQISPRTQVPFKLSSEKLCVDGQHGPDCPHTFVAAHGGLDTYSPFATPEWDQAKTPTQADSYFPTMPEDKELPLPPEPHSYFDMYSPIAAHPCFCDDNPEEVHEESCPFFGMIWGPDELDSSSSSDGESSPTTPRFVPTQADLFPTAILSELDQIGLNDPHESIIFRSYSLKPLPLEIKSKGPIAAQIENQMDPEMVSKLSRPVRRPRLGEKPLRLIIPQ